MATTEHFYAGNNSTTSFPFTFPYLSNSDVKVELNNVVKTENTSGQTDNDYTINNTNIVFNTAPQTGVAIHIYRTTNVDLAQAQYAAGSSIRAADLNNNQTQLLYSAQEAGGQLIRQSDLKDSIVTSAKIVDGSIVDGDINASAAIAGTKVSPNFGSQNIQTSGTAATGNLGVTGNITVSGTVDGRDLAADGTKLDTVETNAKDDQTATEIKTLYESNADTNALTDAEKAVINGVTATTAEINKLDGVTATTAELNLTDGLTATTAELNKLDGVTASTTELNLLDGVTATTAELNLLDGVTATTTELNLVDGVTATTAELNYVDGVTSGIQAQINGKQPLDSELTELATMGSGTAGALADLNTAEVQTLDGITSSTAELNLLDGKSIVTTIGGSATDVQLPSAQAVNERIVELVTEVGGFTPIANETSFPTTNPDINDGAGTIVSIKALASNLVSNGSGVATISNGAGSGNTVTINGLANSTTYAAGKGLLVETTTTLHTYTFHREVIDPTGVTNAQTLVNDFNDRYQVSGSTPSTHPDGSALGDGDLWFDTSANVMKVYDLGNTAYKVVTSVGDFKLLTVVPDGATSGSPTFNGSIVSYDLRDSTNAANVSSVGQLLVSLNGVIQKPNSGSYNASNEGFYLEGTNGIKFCTAPSSGSSLFVTLIGAATSIGTPSDNTVNENKLTSDSVSEGKLKVSNSPVNGYFLSAQSGNTGGLTWAQVTTDLVGDTSPQLGGQLDSNNFDIKLSDGEKLLLHDHGELKTKTGATNAVVSGLTGYVLQNSTILDGGSMDIWLSTTGKKITFGTSDSLTHEVMRVQCSALGASQHGFVNLNYVTANAGGNNSMAQRLATTATGMTFTGVIVPAADSTHDLGTTSVRWRNIYADTLYGDGSNLTGINSDLVSDTSPQLGANLSTNGYFIQFPDSSGATVNRATFGGGNDLQIYHDGTNNIFDHVNGSSTRFMHGSEKMLVMTPDSHVELYYDNSKKLETTTDGTYINDNFLGINVAAPTGTPAGRNAFLAVGDTDTGIAQNGDGQLEAWANNQEIMNFSTGDITSYKTIVPASNNTYDLGSTSLRWRNVYTNDLHLSNEGHSNDVDNTWGDWTIQEGESDLFLKNNRSGKKYKFNLTEVS